LPLEPNWRNETRELSLISVQRVNSGTTVRKKSLSASLRDTKGQFVLAALIRGVNLFESFVGGNPYENPCSVLRRRFAIRDGIFLAIDSCRRDVGCWLFGDISLLFR